MTFSYKGTDRDAALDLPMGGTSLYALAKTNDAVYAKLVAHFRAYKEDFDKHSVAEGTVRFVSMLELFNNVIGDRDRDLDDDSIIDELFANPIAATSQTITGCNSAGAFKTALGPAILATAAAFRQTLAELRQSFALTYRHKDIVSLLGTTKVVTKPGLVKSRVFETAYILDHILDKKRFLATSLMLGIMHVARFQAYKDGERPYYNQGSALFTLLTFSYTPALGFAAVLDRQKRLTDAFTAVQQSGVTSTDDLIVEIRRQGIAKEWAEEIAARGVAGVAAEVAKYTQGRAATAKIVSALEGDDVQFGWKIVGSCLGIDNSLLPITYADAATLWRQFVQPGYQRVVAEDDTLVPGRTAMLDTFEDALATKKLWDKADFASFGITLKASALTEIAYVGPIARIVGWYTSSNHAGYTCSTCKTVHGSRVSLVRLWHRCPTCEKVYCPQCATGMALYAGMILGALAGWWSTAGSLLYAGTIGWLLGSTTGHATSQFAARKCCGTSTEALY